MEASRYELIDVSSKYQEKVKIPCEELASIVFTADQITFAAVQYLDSLKFIYRFPEKIKVIRQIKSVDLHALIGNIGGYIGLFLGNKSDQIYSIFYFQA